MSANTREPSGDVTAALTLLALRSVTSSHVAQFVFPPSEAELTESAALTLLRNAQKPLHCSATLAGDSIAILCHTLVGEERRECEEWRLRVADKDSVAFIRRRASPGTNRVLVRSGNREVIVSLDDLDRWRREYWIAECSFLVPDADSEARARGLAGILKVSCAKSVGSVTGYYMHTPGLFQELLMRLRLLIYRAGGRWRS